MLVVGLTGGIGSGKSTVANMFTELGVPVIDTDVIARQLVEPGQPALKEIEHFFGPKVLDASGQLDRRALREIVFSDPNHRLELEAILHPRIRSAVNDQAVLIKAPYCLVVIPLLVETAQQKMVNHVLLVDAPETLQLERTAQRDQVSVDDVMLILQQQASREQRLAAADDIIHNDDDLGSLHDQVVQMHKRFLQLADSR